MMIAETTVQTKRDSIIDIIKGIGIICMVGGHCEFPIKNFVYLFHMAIFFIASGYCFKPQNTDNFKNLIHYIKRKTVRLWLPYFLWNSVFLCLNNFFIKINVYTDNPQALINNSITLTEPRSLPGTIMKIIYTGLLHGGTLIGAALWFIATLFEISVAYALIDFLIKKICKKHVLIIQLIISLVFLGVGYLCLLKEISLYDIERVFSYYILVFVGIWLRKYKPMEKVKHWYLHVAILAAAFICLLIYRIFGSINLNINRYTNPVYLLITSFSGWFFIYEIAYFVNKIKILSPLFICIGQNTMAVVIFHFLSFKVVSFLGVLAKGEPLYLVAAFATLYKDGWWWVWYSLAGITIPVLMSLGWKRLKGRIYRKYVVK